MSWHDDDDPVPSRTSSVRSVDRHVHLFPLILIGLGASFMLHNIVGHGVSVFPLLIGIFLIMRSGGGDHYPLFVVGVVLTGSGIGNTLGDVISGSAGDALGTLGAACGFAWLAFADPRHRSSWAAIPAAILALIGVGQLGANVSRGLSGSPGWLLPAAVVVVGVLLLGAHRMPGPLRLAGLVFVGAAVLSLLAHSNDGPGRKHLLAPPPVIPTVPSSSIDLPDLSGKTLWVETENGSITVDVGDRGSAAIGGGRATYRAEGNRVTLVSSNGNGSWRIVVPAGTSLHLRTENGAITLAATDDQAIAASSSNGAVVADGFGETATGHTFSHPGQGSSVQIETENGAIVIHRAEAPAGTGTR